MKHFQQQGNPVRSKAFVLFAALVSLLPSLLTGCETPVVGKPAAVPVKAPVAAPAPPPAVAPAPIPEPPPPAPAPVVVPASRLITGAVELLQAGNEEQASADLQRALLAEPNNRLAQMLLKQITDDPFVALGRESHVRKVLPGESLSSLARHYLGDTYLFYILARYNDIKVPRQLAGGQLIKIPGKFRPGPSAAAAAAASAAAAAAASTSPGSPQLSSTPTPAPPPLDANKAERDKAQAITRLTRAARAAFAKQDLDMAINNWDQVLALDANNNTAKLERQRALDLKERLVKVK